MVCELPKLNHEARYSVKDVCTMLGIHRDTLLDYRNRMLIPTHYHKINGRPFFLAKDIQKLFYSEY